jgi:hypothetical protein
MLMRDLPGLSPIKRMKRRSVATQLRDVIETLRDVTRNPGATRGRQTRR